jgi:CDGSH-type Zn-finger protein
LESPVCAKRGSYKEMVEAGKEYWWCACGLSKSQPYCDGSHTGTKFSPMVYKAEESKLVGFCGCKISGKSPLCDGSHKQLPEDA